MPKPNFPFSDGVPFSLTTPTPWLGGMVIPISGAPAQPSRPIAHGLGRVPRFHWFLDIGNNPAFATPRSHPSLPAWTTRTAYIDWPSTGATCLVLFG